MATVNLPFIEGQQVWQVSRSRIITLGKAFLSSGHVTWAAVHGDEQFFVSEVDIKPVPELDKPLEEGEKIQINRVPWTVIRDAFPGMPGGKGAVARKIVDERQKNGDFRTFEELVARMGLSTVNWEEMKQKLDFS